MNQSNLQYQIAILFHTFKVQCSYGSIVFQCFSQSFSSFITNTIPCIHIMSILNNLTYIIINLYCFIPRRCSVVMVVLHFSASPNPLAPSSPISFTVHINEYMNQSTVKILKLLMFHTFKV